MRIRALFILVALALSITLLIAGCSLHLSSGSNSGTTPQAGTEAAQEQLAGEFFNSVGDQDFPTVPDAERVAGYHIPQPGAAYPLAFNQTTLRLFAGERRPTNESQYTYVPMAPTSIGVVVGPAYDWDQQDGTSGEQILSYGTPTPVGPWSGWFTDYQGVFKFRFHCGSVDGVAVWCVVTTTNKIGRDAFDTFVESLR